MKIPMVALSALALLAGLSGCTTVSVPLEKQSALDFAGIKLPDTIFPSKESKTRIAPLLIKEGFHWTDPRYSLGKHLVRGNELFWYDRDQHWHITRYTATFQKGRYKINRYYVNSAHDVHKMNRTTTTSLATCIFTRPAFTFRYHREVSTPTLLTDGLLTGGIDLFLSPVFYLTCTFLDSTPETVREVREKDDIPAEKWLQNALQKGNPIPTNSTTPAWVE